MEGRLQSAHDNSINPSMTELHYVVPDRFQPSSEEIEGMCRKIQHTLGLENTDDISSYGSYRKH